MCSYSHSMKLSVSVATLALLLSVQVAANTWQRVGESQLRVIFWHVYDAEFFTYSGAYKNLNEPARLLITYRRSVKAKDLVKETQQQWQDLGFVTQQDKDWTEALEDIFPDVQAGDQLTFTLNADQSALLEYNNESGHEFPAAKQNQQFLLIWLSDDSAFPEMTKELKGQK